MAGFKLEPVRQDATFPGASPGRYGMQDDPVFQRMCALLAPFNTRQIPLTRQTHITSELEIDSVAVLDLIMEIEDEYGISFPMNLISEIRTIGNLVDAIHQLTGSR